MNSVFRKKNVVELSKVGDRSVLELFHGPTLAFKDVAMQLLGNFYEYYLNNTNEKILYFKKVIKPTLKELENHKEFLKKDLKKNFFN